MYEVCVLLPVFSAFIFGKEVVTVPTGMPLAFVCIWVCWVLRALPPEVYIWLSGPPFLFQVVSFAIATDALQYVMHRVGHFAWRESHAVHHKYRDPTAQDAFRTGMVDACLQLLVPLYVALWTIRPCRAATSCFGISYGLWLQHIHTTPPPHAKYATFFVTPSYHHKHHTHPNKHYGHLLRVWDRLGNTE